MKTFLIIIMILFVWHAIDIFFIGRGGKADRVKRDEKYSFKKRYEKKE